MKLRVGKRLLCKYDYIVDFDNSKLDQKLTVFKKGEYYEIGSGSYMNYKNSIMEVLFNDKYIEYWVGMKGMYFDNDDFDRNNYLWSYFYTEKEVRKLKLEKIVSNSMV